MRRPDSAHSGFYLRLRSQPTLLQLLHDPSRPQFAPRLIPRPSARTGPPVAQGDPRGAARYQCPARGTLRGTSDRTGCSYGSSSRCGLDCVGSRGWLQDVVDLAGDVALEAADDLSFRQALGGAALDVGEVRACGAGARGRPGRGRGWRSVAAAVESVTSASSAAAGMGRPRIGGRRQPRRRVARVVAGGHEYLAGDSMETPAARVVRARRLHELLEVVVHSVISR